MTTRKRTHDHKEPNANKKHKKNGWPPLTLPSSHRVHMLAAFTSLPYHHDDTIPIQRSFLRHPLYDFHLLREIMSFMSLRSSCSPSRPAFISRPQVAPRALLADPTNGDIWAADYNELELFDSQTMKLKKTIKLLVNDTQFYGVKDMCYASDETVLVLSNGGDYTNKTVVHIIKHGIPSIFLTIAESRSFPIPCLSVVKDESSFLVLIRLDFNTYHIYNMKGELQDKCTLDRNSIPFHAINGNIYLKEWNDTEYAIVERSYQENNSMRLCDIDFDSSQFQHYMTIGDHLGIIALDENQSRFILHVYKSRALISQFVLDMDILSGLHFRACFCRLTKRLYYAFSSPHIKYIVLDGLGQ